MLSVFLFAILILRTRGAPNDHYIDHFDLVDANTNTRMRTLKDFDVITTKAPFSVVAIVSGAPTPIKFVTFVSPSYHRELFEPYALAGDNPKGNYSSADLSPGEHLIHAYPDDDIEPEYFGTMRRVQVRPGFPRFGPLPTEVVPRPLKRDEIPVPEAAPTCNCTGPPVVEIMEAYESAFSVESMEVAVQIYWCTTNQDELRLRLIAWDIDENSTVTTTVFQQKRARYLQYPTNFFTNRFCKDQYFFAEACLSKNSTTDGKPEVLCGTSGLRWIPKEIVPEPRLKWRPPILLNLAPGDSVAIITETWIPKDDIEKTDGLSNGGSDTANMKHAIRGIIEPTDGNASVTPCTTARSSVTRVPFRDGGVSLEDNGKLLYLNYSAASCRTSEGSWKERYNTTILVSEEYGSLVKQDSSLPTFSTPVYPETVYKKPTQITVEATNAGGGMRAGDVPTELRYQWYLRITNFIPTVRTYAEAIPGATQVTLNISEAECHTFCDCGRWGCFNLRQYYVDVCNTFGCRRSEEIIPNVVPPSDIREGKVWSEYCCRIEDDYGQNS